MMKNIASFLLIIIFLMFIVSLGAAQEKTPNKYVGVKVCKMCHQSATKGNQFAVWQKTKHSEAYKSLSSEKAAEFAKAKGLKKPASESPECLSCHTITADAKLVEKTFDVKDGVQCEACHGPGSAYKTIATMKDKAKAVAAGLTEYKDETAIEKHCRTCHNEKSPAYKEFKLKTMWDKIKHPIKS